MTSQSRRVSFDLEHTTVHVLPTNKQEREMHDKLRREAYQNRTLIQELPDESIISEIVLACRYHARALPHSGLKGCLKSPPTPSSPPPNKRKSKKSKRRMSHRATGVISVH
ncbi:hypothetical protein DM01DRAFT_1332872 [Hesseltinella vesiculosa]|uniref:Uncharacterized protein n=1 Tax=Hesseltinella vesiculosa TaxID=101127 RepID=A0A1X2GQL0_9FUNG|nr:hypothetical protein DM01DRAFT_1332872 [Hesseltinella vesiculosa]